MKKQELLKYFDDELMDKLYGFCYGRTGDSYEAQFVKDYFQQEKN